VVVIVVFVLAAAITGRVMLQEEEPTGSPDAGGLQTGLVAGGGEQVEKEEALGDKLGKLLPYVTEAAAALLLGMIAGIGTRMAIKTIVVVLILGVVGWQFAVFKGWVEAGEYGFLAHMRDFVFHIPEGKDAGEVMMDKAPSLGAGLLGFLMGLKKG